MSDFDWTCPHCEHAVTISDSRVSTEQHILDIQNKTGRRTFVTQFIVCPNSKCQKFTLRATLYESRRTPNGAEVKRSPLQSWALVPPSGAKTFPDYVPHAIREDYGEACLIANLSPKASATLSRRCLQGIIRDFWKVTPGRLVDEIDEIKEHVDGVTWQAIDAVRKLGNIGAHMEKDINVIVDVDSGEAKLLIGLVETLLREWYIAREDRKARMTAVINAAASKKPADVQALTILPPEPDDTDEPPKE